MKFQLHLFRPKNRSILACIAGVRSDFDNFARRRASDEALRDAWRSANTIFKLFLFEARKTTERIDRRYSIFRRLTSIAQLAVERIC